MDNNFIDFKIKYKLKLNSQQEAVVQHINGPAVVLAVAGAGKTTCIVSRIGNLVLNNSINPDSILTMTFSKASARDMKDRFYELFGKEIKSNIEFSTIHSFAYKVMYTYSKNTGTSYNLIEEEKDNDKPQNRITKYRVLREIGLKYLNKYLSEDQLEELISNISFVKNMILKEEEFKEYGISFPKFNEIYEAYEEFKIKNNLIDYDDMLTLAYDILHKNPNILNKLRSKYSYIQIDEAQDTSPIQFEIIKLLAYPKNNIVFVGDDDQSIYRFRGTKPEIMLNFEKNFIEAKSYFMEENFRSTQNIIKLANSFIKGNSKRFKKNIFTEKTELMPPQIIYTDNEVTQVEYIIDKLKKSSEGTSHAVLFRNNQSAIYIMDRLNQHGFNFYTKDFKNKFFKHWIIRDMFSFINVALDPSDIESFSNIYYKTNGYISKNLLEFAGQTLINRKDTVFNAMRSYPLLTERQRININRLESSFNSIKYSPGDGFTKIIEYQLGYSAYLEKQSNSNSNGNFKNILGTFKLVTKDLNNINEVYEKLKELENILKKSTFNSNSNITLTTAHSSKGLEFDNVYVIDIAEDIFPTFGSIKKAKDEKIFDELEEERRLMYVAITRAKEMLYLFSLNYKHFNKCNKSIFINEIERILNIGSNSNIEKNKLVEHSKFGIGRIIDIKGGIITVNFNSGEKHLNLDICLENNLLKIPKF